MQGEDGAGRRRTATGGRDAPGPDDGCECDDPRSYALQRENGACRASVWLAGRSRAAAGGRDTPDRGDGCGCDDPRSYVIQRENGAWRASARLAGRPRAAAKGWRALPRTLRQGGLSSARGRRVDRRSRRIARSYVIRREAWNLAPVGHASARTPTTTQARHRPGNRDPRSSAVPIPWLLNLRAAMPCNVRIGVWWRFGALARGPLLAPIGTPGLFGALQGSVVDRLACDSACVQERTGRQTSPLRRYLMQPENGELHAWARMPPPSPSPLRVSTWVRSSRPKPASAGEVRTPVFLAPRSRATQMHPTPPPPATQDLT
jgi:hypothetical protein